MICPICNGTGLLHPAITRANWRSPEAKRERHDYMHELRGKDAGITLTEIALCVRRKFGADPRYGGKLANHASILQASFRSLSCAGS